jgi:hypothetical protein
MEQRNDDDIVQEVMEASSFYRRCVASDERLRGERALIALRSAHRKRSRKGRSK